MAIPSRPLVTLAALPAAALLAIALLDACNFPRPADVAGEAGPSDASLPGEAAPDGALVDGTTIDAAPDAAPDAPDPPGTVLHVSPTGDDANDGLTMPVKTLKHAIGLAAANSAIRSIVLASGRYSTTAGETFPYAVPANVSVVGPAGGGAILAGTNAEVGMTVDTGELKDLELESFTVAVVATGMTHVVATHIRASAIAVRAETAAKLAVDNLDITGTAGACSPGVVLNGAATLTGTTLATRKLGTALQAKDQSMVNIARANLSGDRTCDQPVIEIRTNQTFVMSDSLVDDGNTGIVVRPGPPSGHVTIMNSVLRGAKVFAINGGCGSCGSIMFKMDGGEISSAGQGGAEVSGGSWEFDNVMVRQNGAFGIDSESGTLVMRNCTVSGNIGDGVSIVSPVAIDLGTVAFPGNNVFQGNSLGLSYSPGNIQVEAVGNTWNPRVQGADDAGKYVPDFIGGPIPPTLGNNYTLSCDPGQCTLHR